MQNFAYIKITLIKFLDKLWWHHSVISTMMPKTVNRYCWKSNVSTFVFVWVFLFKKSTLITKKTKTADLTSVSHSKPLLFSEKMHKKTMIMYSCAVMFQKLLLCNQNGSEEQNVTVTLTNAVSLDGCFPWCSDSIVLPDCPC